MCCSHFVVFMKSFNVPLKREEMKEKEYMLLGTTEIYCCFSFKDMHCLKLMYIFTSFCLPVGLTNFREQKYGRSLNLRFFASKRKSKVCVYLSLNSSPHIYHVQHSTTHPTLQLTILSLK